MAMQIANPVVVDKITRLAQVTGLNKTAAVERAVDRLLAETQQARGSGARDISLLLAQMDRIPERDDRFVDPLDWDEVGLPR